MREFIVAFHERLAIDNPGREIAAERTESQRMMDALGRLLVGDEICAAVAADGTRLFVSSNATNHSYAQASFSIHSFTFRVNDDGKQVTATGKIKVNFLLDDGSQQDLRDLEDINLGEYEYDRNKHSLRLLNGAKVECEIP